VTPRTQEVLRRAERHARRRGDADLDGAHILLAILETPNVAVAALKTLGVRAARVRRALKGLPTRPRAPVQDHVPIRVGAAARRCLEGALSEALGLGHNYIGTEHLVLGILHVDRSSAARALHAEGVTLESARRAVQHAISDYLRTRT